MNDIKNYIPCNPNDSNEVKSVMKYLSDISGKYIITGQHTQTTLQPELKYIKEVTGKLPALCGFELLSYSPNINYETCDEGCLKEINENKEKLQNAWDWSLNRNGLVTFTWHWFSPFGSFDKGFYSKNTTFDASKAIINGTDENKALLSDLDYMAEILKGFCNKHIPILWRPFHESEGDWFWWSKMGYDVARQLYRLMYERYTNYHKLNNLIWVWNSPLIEGYVGDDVVDVITRDLYPPAHKHTDLHDEYEELIKITQSNKLTAIGEIGTIPSVLQLSKSNIPLAWFMTWSNEYGKTDLFTSRDELYNAYNSDYAITLDKLQRLY